MEELLNIVDENDIVKGVATRSEVHGNPALIHRVAHVLVFNSQGELFLQKRAMDKDVQPGKWDTSVGGHIDAGEDYATGARREMAEELGIAAADLKFLYKYRHENAYESEYVATYSCVWDGKIVTAEDEIDEGRFWSLPEIEENLDTKVFTPNFIDELGRYKAL